MFSKSLIQFSVDGWGCVPSLLFGGGLVSKSVPFLYPMDCSPTRLLCLWDSPGKNTGVGCHFLLQGIFPTKGLNPGLLCCRQSLPTELRPKVKPWWR